jgi:hypothetical protein
MENTKTMYAIEYKSYDGSCTFDIFETCDKAEKHAQKINSFGFLYKPLFIFKAKFNPRRIYKEDNEWNYNDSMDIFNYDTLEIVRHIVA